MSAPIPQPPPPARLLRLAAVMDRSSLCCASIYMRINKGTFPRPVSLPGGYRVAWREADIEDWIASLPLAKRPGPCPRRRSAKPAGTPE